MTAATQPQPTILAGYKQTEVGIIPENWEFRGGPRYANSFVGISQKDKIMLIFAINLQI